MVTDHKPLLGIFNNRDLASIENLRVQRFKSRTLHYRFNIQHCPGKWHRGADAVSRNPSKAAPFPVAAFAITSDPEDEKVFDDLLLIENELDS